MNETPKKSKFESGSPLRLLLIYELDQSVGHYSRRTGKRGQYQYEWRETNCLAIALAKHKDSLWRISSSYPYRFVY